MKQSRSSNLYRPIIVAAVLACLALIIWSVIGLARGWTPSRDQFPLQGVTVSAANGPVSWRALAAQDVDFGYIEATRGSDIRDERFIENYTDARAAGVGFAPLHHYSLCRLASDQGEIFVTTVPRDDSALPAAIALDFEQDCAARPAQSLVISELVTFLNQVESHMGKPAILRISPEFEEAYAISSSVARNVWLSGDYFPPDYATKPWVMWTANNSYSIDGVAQPVAWNVIRPKDSPTGEQMTDGQTTESVDDE